MRGTQSGLPVLALNTGITPRMRGTQVHTGAGQFIDRITPAHAGNTMIILHQAEQEFRITPAHAGNTLIEAIGLPSA